MEEVRLVIEIYPNKALLKDLLTTRFLAHIRKKMAIDTKTTFELKREKPFFLITSNMPKGNMPLVKSSNIY